MNESFEELFENANDELKRVDHLIYVSLKYTRTCDIFKNIFERLISALDFSFLAVLQLLHDQGKVMEVPGQPGSKCNLLKEYYTDEKVAGIVDFYLKMRQINRTDFSRDREYRRHVTMTIALPDETITITIDNITDYFRTTKESVEYLKTVVAP
ncbi:hypothetical protein HYS47_05570 [Candidatus Woesearchaeota archaeon]|nr:hypothetical protein [Candidatus Woesearchaeota archaeon]